jgi:hypothetical protein
MEFGLTSNSFFLVEKENQQKVPKKRLRKDKGHPRRLARRGVPSSD